MKKILAFIDQFFFEEISASSIGLMRILWAATILVFLIRGMPDIVRYYSDAGIMPQDLGYLVFRNHHRFTLLAHLTSPTAVIGLWSIFVACLICSMLGIWTRTMTITSALLLFSFQERNLQPLGGGDTVLRTIGFILMICPEINAFSLERLLQQWKRWKQTGTFLQPLTVHIWPYRLLLWQMILIYVTSGWDKLQGTMWLNGTALEASFHHPHFARWSMETMNNWIWMSPLASVYTLVWEFSWLLLLVPLSMCRYTIRRVILVGGLLFHWTIFIFMNVGSFPFAMTTAYTGLLRAEDWTLVKRLLNRKWNGSIVVLYDGICTLCRRSIFVVLLLDVLSRIQPVDFRDAKRKKTFAKEITETDLDRAMHIKMPDGTTFKGFDAFRKLTWHLPALRLLTPFLYIPGVAPVGRIAYRAIAARRNRCAEGACVHVPKS